MTYTFYTTMRRYGLPHRSFFCPFTDDQTVNLTPTPGANFQQGYEWWAPRSTSTTPRRGNLSSEPA